MKLRLTDKGRACLLTPIEMDVLEHLAMGLTTKELAFMRHVSPKTISEHREDIYRKTGYRSDVELCRFAIRLGLIDP